MKTILEIIKLSTEFLQQKGITDPRKQAEELVSDALKLERINLYLYFDRPLNNNELEQCRKNLLRRAQGEPYQYIRGEVDFYHCQIKVNSDVLIPRHETEILVDRIVQDLKTCSLEGKVLWDLCCGSGCIGIAIKKQFPHLKVILVDISNAALKVAAQNAHLNQVDVELLEGDLLTPLIGRQADYIVCNPPYIAEHEFETLDIEVNRFEPKLALVSGQTGLEFYQRLSEQLISYLHPGSKVWMEIGYRQKESILTLFSKSPWTKARVDQDWAGHDRFLQLK